MCLALGRLASGVSHVFASWCGILLWEPIFFLSLCALRLVVWLPGVSHVFASWRWSFLEDKTFILKSA